MTQTIRSSLFFFYAVLVAVLPWSIPVSLDSSQIRLPSELLSALLGILLFQQAWSSIRKTQTAFRKQFLFFAVSLWLLWDCFCSFYSTMPFVSLKYWVVEAGQWWIFFAGMLLLPTFWQRLLPIFTWSVAGTTIYTLLHHASYQFRADQSMLSPLPFFPDHTLYSAVMGMLLPVIFLFFRRKYALVLLPLFLAGLVFANCRAAWLSLAATALLLVPVYLQKKWTGLAFSTAFLLFALAGFQLLFKNRIAQDVSSMERLNRYNAAWTMAADRPLTGFGTGTYQFQYLPYQQAEDLTRISIIDPTRDLKPGQYGRGGGAHSEYFQALAEKGWPGLLLWMLVAGASIFWGLHIYFYAASSETQLFALAVTASLLTFFIHTLFNNFLHDGRIAFLVWGQIAWLAGANRSTSVNV